LLPISYEPTSLSASELPSSWMHCVWGGMGIIPLVTGPISHGPYNADFRGVQVVQVGAVESLTLLQESIPHKWVYW
jgi:hypothetical protein